jgi:FkbM family methyltransferase
MLTINYDKRLSYNFPKYYDCDVNWYAWSEMETKKYYLENIKPNYNIIDAGAQIGMYTVFFSKLANEGMVYSFEPTDTFVMLNENVLYNNCTNVKTYNVALSNKDGKYIDTIYKIWSKQETEKKEFEFVTIDSFILKEKIIPNLIKIDVDTYDFEVLQGSIHALKTYNPEVIVELNSELSRRGYSIQHAVDFMQSIGYRVKNIFERQNFLFTKDKV